MSLRKSLGDKIIDWVIIFFMILIIIVMVFPIWNTLVISFNEARDSVKGGIYLWPRVWSLYNYESIFKTNTIFDSFFISVYRTVISTVLNVVLAALLAYILSRQEFVLRKALTLFMVLTMYINAGLIPQYFLYRDLGLLNNFWVYILPSMVGPFNVIVIRTYIKGLPESLIESAKLDGATETRIFAEIIFPLCMPILATVALWAAVGAWNSWFDAFIFTSDQKLSTLQYEMYKILQSSQQQGSQSTPLAPGEIRDTVTPKSIQAAMTMVATVPILCVYPFLQKYFVTVNIGSVKE